VTGSGSQETLDPTDISAGGGNGGKVTKLDRVMCDNVRGGEGTDNAANVLCVEKTPER